MVAGFASESLAGFNRNSHDASKETLKSLQDLRKSLADDVTRVVSQTRELTGTLWRDLLVVFAAVLGRFTLFSTPGTGEAGLAETLLYGLAAYLFISIGMTLTANHRFMTIFREAQTQWRSKLFGFVDTADFETLAVGPLDKAEQTYRCIRNAAIAAYGLAIAALIALATLTPAKPADPRNKDEKAASTSSNAAITSSSPTSDMVGVGRVAKTFSRKPRTASSSDEASGNAASTGTNGVKR